MFDISPCYHKRLPALNATMRDIHNHANLSFLYHLPNLQGLEKEKYRLLRFSPPSSRGCPKTKPQNPQQIYNIHTHRSSLFLRHPFASWPAHLYPLPGASSAVRRLLSLVRGYSVSAPVPLFFLALSSSLFCTWWKLDFIPLPGRRPPGTELTLISPCWYLVVRFAKLIVIQNKQHIRFSGSLLILIQSNVSVLFSSSKQVHLISRNRIVSVIVDSSSVTRPEWRSIWLRRTWKSPDVT